jgi:hypothetical protein
MSNCPRGCSTSGKVYASHEFCVAIVPFVSLLHSRCLVNFALLLVCPQVALWCGWTQWLRNVVLKGKGYVCINLDETMVRHEYFNPKGNIIKKQQLSHRGASGLVQRVRRDHEKAGTTLMAAICDDDELQKHMPQIWLPKDSPTRPMPLGLQDEFRTALTHGYPQQVWGGTGGWMTAQLFSEVLRTVCRRVRDVRGDDVVIVVIFDAAGSHVTNDVLEVAKGLGIVVLLIPGQLTWLLQMLDVKVFGRLKARLRVEFMRERALSPDGRMPNHRWASIAVDAVRDLLVNRTWQRSFDTMRIPSKEVPENSFRRLQALAPSLSDLPPMPMTPQQLDALLGRHRICLLPVLFQRPIEIMPDEERIALRDRMRSMATGPCLPPPASLPSSSSVAPPLIPAPLPASISRSSIAGRVALRRRTTFP